MDRIYRIEYAGSKRYAAEHNGRLFLLDGDLFGEYGFGEEIARGEFPRDLPAGSRLLAPVVPSKIVAIGLNYKDHAAEQKKPLPAEPMLFIKPSTAVIGPGDPIQLPSGVGRVDYESEVAVVIGKHATGVPRERALEHVLGYTCANDVTARELQNRGYQYSHVKGYDTFAPIGPAIAIGLDPGAIGAGLAERADEAGLDDRAADLQRDGPDCVRLCDHDAPPWRHHLDGHAVGNRAARAGRRVHGPRARHRGAHESSGSEVRSLKPEARR
jgi:hypothetical protein